MFYDKSLGNRLLLIKQIKILWEYRKATLEGPAAGSMRSGDRRLDTTYCTNRGNTIMHSIFCQNFINTFLLVHTLECYWFLNMALSFSFKSSFCHKVGSNYILWIWRFLYSTLFWIPEAHHRTYARRLHRRDECQSVNLLCIYIAFALTCKEQQWYIIIGSRRSSLSNLSFLWICGTKTIINII